MQRACRTAAALLAACAPAALAQEPRGIFDGKSLDGFVGETGFWSVENGELVGRSTAAHPLTHSTWLFWRLGEVADFKLELEYKLVGGNSGVQFRSQDRGGFQAVGYQADLEDGPNWSGCLYEQEGRGVCARRGESVRFDADGTRTALDVADGAKLLENVRPREWNRYTIVARGPSIALAINGVPMTNVTDLDPAHAAAQGLIAFQLHEGPPMEVRFRNIRLTEYEFARTAGPVPQWIWCSSQAKEKERAFFEKRFQLPSAPQSARISGSADNYFQVFVNGVAVLDHDEWEKPVSIDVAAHLHAGENTLTIRAENDGGPAGIHCALDFVFDDGEQLRVSSDATWSAASSDDAKDSRPAPVHSPWKNAVTLGPLGTGPWGKLPAPVPFAPTRALAAEELKVPPGFTAELLYSVPRRAQGSWVAMCFDDRGRIIASDQYGPLYRATLEHGGLAGVEQLDLPLGHAQGLCYAFDALYVVVSSETDGYGPGLWRAKRRAADNAFEAPELLKKFDGNGEHGPHAVVLAPDGRSLFVVGGNHTKPPEPLARSLVPTNWGEDQLLPQHADPNGHAVGITAPGGWICRTDRDGKEWELFACGFRNAYDMAFDADGEAFTFDSDMEWDMGLPWYRPTMIQHVVPGGEYGWRTGSWRWPEYYPDSLPGVVDIGASSPTGICFVPKGSKFVAPNHGTLLVGDWAYGKILSVALTKSGASYTGSFETFVEGKPLPVTDMEFGPDGALYFLVGGRRTQSALYRITGSAAESTGGRPVIEREAESLSDAQRKQARSFVLSSEFLLDEAFAALDSPDRFLRYSARLALERSNSQAWSLRALRESRSRASIEALIALAHRRAKDAHSDNGNGQSERELFAKLPLASMDEELLLGALRALELCLIRRSAEYLTREEADALAARLDGLYPSKSNLANRELCQLLVYLESPTVVAKTLALIDAANSKEDQIAFAWALRSLKVHWTLEQRARYFRWMNRTAAGWSGGLSFSKYLDLLRDDAVATLSPEELRLLAELVDKPRAVEAAATAEPRPFVRRWSVDELVPAATAAHANRDFSRARSVYKEARCFECHRIAGQGGGSGPDLTGAGSRFSDRDLLEALLEPSKTISDQYQDTEVLTADDRLFTGRLERRAGGGVRLWQPDAKDPIEIAAEDVASIRPSPLSRMPKGLLDSFREEELLDLLAYLRAGANEDDAAFAKR